jgi:hypothetical protein
MSAMSIYLFKDDDEFIINLKTYYENNSFDLKDVNITPMSSADPWNKNKKGLQVAWNKGLKSEQSSIRKKEYWNNWRKNNPNYKEKWLTNNYIKKGYDSEWRKNSMTKTNKLLHECPHCKKKANIGNLKRWHMDKCKDAL